jgi:hypothetical protein
MLSQHLRACCPDVFYDKAGDVMGHGIFIQLRVVPSLAGWMA